MPPVYPLFGSIMVSTLRSLVADAMLAHICTTDVVG